MLMNPPPASYSAPSAAPSSQVIGPLAHPGMLSVQHGSLGSPIQGLGAMNTPGMGTGSVGLKPTGNPLAPQNMMAALGR